VIAEMVNNKEVNLSNSHEIKYQEQAFGDFKFVIRDSFLSFDNNMPFWKNILMKSYYNLKYMSVKEHINFGLDKSNLIIEKYPLVVTPYKESKLLRHSKNK
jgi:KUP system potassium uptake protein